MQKKGVILSVLVLVFSVFSSVIVSAGWWSNLVDKITGNAVLTERGGQTFGVRTINTLTSDFIIDEGNVYVTGVRLNWTDFGKNCKAKLIIGDYPSDFISVGDNVEKGFWSINKEASKIRVKLEGLSAASCPKIKINSLSVWYNKTGDSSVVPPVGPACPSDKPFEVTSKINLGAGYLKGCCASQTDCIDDKNICFADNSLKDSYWACYNKEWSACNSDNLNAVSGKYTCDGTSWAEKVTPTTCTDSDGGLDYYVAGNVDWGNKDLLDSCVDIPAMDALGVREYYCENGEGKFVDYKCLNGCSNGACVNATIQVEPKPACDENYKIRAINFVSEGSLVNETDIQYYQNGAWVDKRSGAEEGDIFSIGNLEMTVGRINRVNKEVVLSASSSGVIDYKQLENKQFSVINSNSIVFDYDNDDWFVASYCGNVTCTDSDGGLNYYVKGIVSKEGVGEDKCKAQCGSTPSGLCDSSTSLLEYYCDNNGNANSLFYACPNGCEDGACVNASMSISNCNDVIDLMEAPQSLSIGNYKFGLNYNSSYESSGGKYYSASWSYSGNNENSYIWMSVNKLSDQDAVEQRLNDALEEGLCNSQQIWIGEEEPQTVYLCKNLWRLAYENQGVSSSGDAWNYNNDIFVIWFNDDKLFNVEFSTNNYWSCYSTEDCERIKDDDHRRKQEDLINVVDKLINNENMWANTGHLDYLSEMFLKYFLKACPSKVAGEDYNSWQCRMDPVICPPHGEQKQVCTKWNSVIKKYDTRETTLNCNPGICSGCMVPKWFEQAWSAKCIEYGFRFKQPSGYTQELVEYESKETLSDRVEGDVLLTVHGENSATLVLFGRYEDGTIINKSFELTEGKKINLSDMPGWGVNANIIIEVLDINYNPSGESSIEIKVSHSYMGQILQSYSAYCDIDGQVKQQKKTDSNGEWAECQNNYECDSNLCSSGECIDLQAIAKDANAFKNAWAGITCRITSFLGIDSSFEQCMYDSFGVGGTSSSTGGGGGGSSS